MPARRTCQPLSAALDISSGGGEHLIERQSAKNPCESENLPPLPGPNCGQSARRWRGPHRGSQRCSDVSRRTVQKWLRRFREFGPAGLVDRSSAPISKPRKQLQPGSDLNTAVASLLHAPPSEYGFNRTSWRMRDLKAVLDQQGKTATLNNIRASIRSTGFRWKRARIALTSTDPTYGPNLMLFNIP